MVKSGKMKKVVLVRLETSPEDIVGMQVSQGILTVRGGMTSHAAVVARGMGTCCVSGCGNDNEDVYRRQALTDGEIAKEAEFFSFGTNDLTQMTFGFSRDDAAKFLGAYYENKIYERNIFLLGEMGDFGRPVVGCSC